MKTNEKLWLLQKFDNGDFFIYGWTPIQAAKGYKVLTAEQVKPYLDLQAKGENNVKYLKDVEIFDSAKETNNKSGFNRDEAIRKKKLEEAGLKNDEDTQGIIDEVAGKGEAYKPNLDEVRDIEFAQEDIQAAEMKYIKGLQHKTSLESHMLTKYQCEIPMGRLDVMKAMANGMINDLAKENRLYYIDGGVVSN
jgi:hypothetical protein